MATLALILMVSAIASVLDQSFADRTVLRVRVYADNHLDSAILRTAQDVAEGLLTSAGLVTKWRLCAGAASCEAANPAVPEVIVILLSRDCANGRDNCAYAARTALDSRGTAVVSVPCLARAAFGLTRNLDTRSSPLLANPRHADLVGAVIAHEIGHLLGLGHARTGLMRASLQAEDIIALRRGKLRFSAQESARMRATLLVRLHADTMLRTAR